jgi:hypothetical protein
MMQLFFLVLSIYLTIGILVAAYLWRRDEAIVKSECEREGVPVWGVMITVVVIWPRILLADIKGNWR